MEAVQKLGYEQVSRNVTNSSIETINEFNRAGRQNTINYNKAVKEFHRQNPNKELCLDINSDKYTPLPYERGNLLELSNSVDSEIRLFAESEEYDESTKHVLKRTLRLDWDNFESPSEDEIETLRKLIERDLREYYKYPRPKADEVKKVAPKARESKEINSTANKTKDLKPSRIKTFGKLVLAVIAVVSLLFLLAMVSAPGALP